MADILVVENDKDKRAHYCRLVMGQGHQAIPAGTIEEGLQCAQQRGKGFHSALLGTASDKEQLGGALWEVAIVQPAERMSLKDVIDWLRGIPI